MSITVKGLVVCGLSAASILAGAGSAFADGDGGGPMALDIVSSCPTMKAGGPASQECVRALQDDLNYLGASIEADGIYGDETGGAVARFQSTFGQEPSGEATYETRQAIVSDVQANAREEKYDPESSNPVCDAAGDIPLFGGIAKDACGIVADTPAAG